MPPRRRRRNDGTTDRERLLDAAEAAFAEKGFHGATVAEIAARAECDPRAVFNAYGSKRGLYDAVLARHRDAIDRFNLEGPHLHAFAELGRRAGWAVLTGGWYRYGADHPARMRIVNRETLEDGRAFRRRCEPILGRMDRDAEKLVVQLRDIRWFPDLDLKHFFMSLDGLYYHYFLAAPLLGTLEGGNRFSPEAIGRWAAEVSDLLLYGIPARPLDDAALERALAEMGDADASPAVRLGYGGDDAKRGLLDAAEALFAQWGFKGVKSRAIEETAGTAHGSINHHFGSVRELHRAALRRVLAGLAWFEMSPRFQEGDPLLAYARLAAGLIDFAARRPAGVRLFLREALDGGEDLRALLGDFMPAVHRLAVERIQSRQASGALRAFDPAHFLTSLGGLALYPYAAADFYRARWRFFDPLSPEEVARRKREVARLLLGGVRRPLGTP